MKYYNYPYNALEEAVVNAVFHKSYRDDSPVEIRIYVDEIVILNYQGPAKWIDMEKFAQGKVRARKYRNRRIGEFFKELDLSEKQSTGIPTILAELKKNGSPMPEFETDDERNYLETTIKIRDGFAIDLKAKQDTFEGVEDELKHAAFIIDMDIEKFSELMEFMNSPRTRKELQDFCGYKSRDYFRNKILIPLINAGKIDMTIPDKPQSSKQKYVRKSQGKSICK